MLEVILERNVEVERLPSLFESSSRTHQGRVRRIRQANEKRSDALTYPMPMVALPPCSLTMRTAK